MYQQKDPANNAYNSLPKDRPQQKHHIQRSRITAAGQSQATFLPKSEHGPTIKPIRRMKTTPALRPHNARFPIYERKPQGVYESRSTKADSLWGQAVGLWGRFTEPIGPENLAPGNLPINTTRSISWLLGRSSQSLLLNPDPHTSTLLPSSLTKSWDHAVRLFQDFEIEESLMMFTYLNLMQKSFDVDILTPNASMLWANVGILHWHLGELSLAKQHLSNAVCDSPQTSIYWFLLGCVYWESEDYTRAELYFDACLGTFARGIEQVDYREQGLDIVLRRKEVQWNATIAGWRARKENAVYPENFVGPFDEYGINRLPGGKIFRSPGGFGQPQWV
jgi:hypothetical protein